MEGDVDAVIIGTGLTESIVAAALSKAGFTIAHIDKNSYYGGDDASLTVDELIQWADRQSRAEHSAVLGNAEGPLSGLRFTSISCFPSILPQSRQFALSLSPAIIPSVGPHISALISSGVARYHGFGLLERTAIYSVQKGLQKVPGSKEDIFKNKELKLIDKRRLMRFLTFAGGDFEHKEELEGRESKPFLSFLTEVFCLAEDMAETIAYSLAHCTSSTDATLPTLQRLRSYLHGTGRYGSSSFLLGHYGGSGEIAQGFCRLAAVHGGIYILGQSMIDITTRAVHDPSISSHGEHHMPSRNYSINLEDLSDPVTCDVIISPPLSVPRELHHKVFCVPPAAPSHMRMISQMARCIAIIDKPVAFPSASLPVDASEVSTEQMYMGLAGDKFDSALITFPPGFLQNHFSTTAATVLITGEGTMCAPTGKWVIYISIPLVEKTSRSAEELLQPYLDTVLSFVPCVSGPEEHDSAHVAPLFRVFYFENFGLENFEQSSTSSVEWSASRSYIVPPPPSAFMSDFFDTATLNAEAVFWEAVKVLKKSPRVVEKRMMTAEGPLEINSFWPPRDNDPDEGDDNDSDNW